MIRVIVVDDHHLVRQGIRALLDKATDIQVVAEAGDGPSAVAMVARLVPDVVVMDVSMPRMGGTQVIEQLRARQLPSRVVMLSMYSDETLVRQALRCGAQGYLLKDALAEDLLLAIRAVYRRDRYLSPAIRSLLAAEDAAPDAAGSFDPFQRLSPREREVLQLVAEGHTNNAIARLLQVSAKTIEKHRASLMDKLNVRDIAGLTRVAIKYGLIGIDC